MWKGVWCVISYSNQRLLAYTPFISATGSCITAERDDDDDDDDCFYIALFSTLKQTHCACMWFYSAFLNIHQSGVLTTLAWLVPHETAAVLMHSVYTIQPCTMSLHHQQKATDNGTLVEADSWDTQRYQPALQVHTTDTAQNPWDPGEQCV